MQQQKKPGLSVVIITLNEEVNIGRCIQSVLQVADEIIVVDSLSADNTKAICRSYAVTFIEQPFLGYIEQKNFALQKANHTYILSLDADEALSEGMISFLMAEKAKGFSCDGYVFNRFNNYCGQWIKHGTYYPDKKLRLIKSGMASWGGQNPHDKLIPVDGSKVRYVKKDILHYIYRSYDEHISQMNKFSTIAANALFLRNKRPSYLKAIVNPAWAFVYAFFIRLGFLDGWNGYMIAKLQAFQTFGKYSKLIQLHKQKEP
ncbi:MAG: glycosyltransferase family 2 protein [Bacteroidota bacterium]